MDADLDTLATALYARVDDVMKDHPELVPWRPKVGIAPKLSDAELLTLAVLQVLQGFNEEARWLRHADKHLRHLAWQVRYNKRLRKSAEQLQALIRILGQDTDVWADDTWLIDSTPVETARSRPTVKRSNLAGYGYGYCASHSRSFMVCGYISYAPRQDCRSRSRWPTRKSMNETSPSKCSTTTRHCSTVATCKPSLPTKAMPAASSSPASPTTASNSCAPHSNENRNDPEPDNSNRSARSSSQSSTP